MGRVLWGLDMPWAGWERRGALLRECPQFLRVTLPVQACQDPVKRLDRIMLMSKTRIQLPTQAFRLGLPMNAGFSIKTTTTKG
jgi:hypothetical protein